MTVGVAWLDIPGGVYTLGAAGLPDAPRHSVAVAAFRLARTPVTNRQYADFIAANGYTTEAYWPTLGWRWATMRRVDRPAFWGQSPYAHPDQPVVGVTWFEATAFACWLAAATGGDCHLPTEAEWEAAARGTDERLFPWGDVFDVRRANTAESGLGRPTPVTRYLAGASPWGALDMAGNVYEWVSTAWGHNWQTLDYPYPYRADDGREALDGSPARVMRGGSWFNPWPDACCAARARYLPGSRGSSIGFRLAAQPRVSTE